MKLHIDFSLIYDFVYLKNKDSGDSYNINSIIEKQQYFINMITLFPR